MHPGASPRGKRRGAPPDGQIAAIAASQHGLITIAQLARVGLSPSAVTKRVERGVLFRRYRGVYVVGQPALSQEGEWMAAVLAAGPGAVLSHVCAAQLHGISRFRSPRITVLSPWKRRPEGVVVHTVRSLDARDVTTHKGIPVTTVHRTQVDLSDVQTPYQLANVIHEAAYRGRFVEAAVRDSMARAKGRHKLHVLERAIELHHEGCPGTRSAAEDAFLALGPPEPRVNMDLLGEEVDFHWPELRLVVELDGPGHGRPASRRDDERRDRKLREAGYAVVRLT